MTPTEKLALCDQMSIDLVQMTEAGIRATEGDLSNERLIYLTLAKLGMEMRRDHRHEIQRRDGG